MDASHKYEEGGGERIATAMCEASPSQAVVTGAMTSGVAPPSDRAAAKANEGADDGSRRNRT